tara:strand:+ start:399 stop:716 length:318 start_codon:yes stop_codon:yes gene_type:complete
MTLTKEDARMLIAHLKELYFNEKTHIEISAFYRDGYNEYTERHTIPMQDGVDYDNLSQHEIMDMFFFMQDKSIAEDMFDEQMGLYWDIGMERAVWIDITKVVKEE